MTHDELLAKLSWPLPITMTLVGQNKVTDALRAVVKLHKPSNLDYRMCFYCPHEYPCPTILAIEKELG
jgi:hypothetical protein